MLSAGNVSITRAYPQNYLSAKLGARVFTQAKLAGNANPNVIRSDGPISKGRIRFAPVDQEQVFTVDLGQVRRFDRVQIGTGRNAQQIQIKISSQGQEGTYKIIYALKGPAYFQIVRFSQVEARWIRFDFGSGKNGAAVHSVRIYQGYKHPGLAKVARFLYERIKPDIDGLKNFYAAASQNEWKKACSELRAYYAVTKKPESQPNPNYDLNRAETLAAGKLDFAGLARVDTHPVDWSYMKTTDWYEHKNFLNRGSPLGVPIDAYYHTGDIKWANHFRNVFYDWIDENPKPTVMSGADYPTWRTLDTAARAGWIVSRFATVTTGKNIDDELWANYLFSIWEHADYLKNDNFSGGNWLATITSAVMNIAQQFPEFRDRKTWLTYGKESFERNVLRDIYPDGKEMEDAPGYICMAYKGMFSTMESLEEETIEINPEVKKRMNKVLDFLGAVTQPNGNMPAIGDWGGGPPYGMDKPIEYFQREDIHYIITKGKEGIEPKITSIHFPHGGWSIMRSAYLEHPFENARHLVFKTSWGAHGHHDVLNVTAYAYGRELLIDPGIRSYEHEDVRRYTHTSYHNTICINGKTQPRKAGKTLSWISNSGLDFVAGIYDGYPNLTQQRSVLFVKPAYWIVWDDLLGKGRHSCDQNWHFAPDANIIGDPIRKTVRTQYKQGGNILLVPVQPEILQAQSFDFLVATKRYSSEGGNTPAKGWKYSQTGTPPRSFAVLLYPYPQTDAPIVTVTDLNKENTLPHNIKALQIQFQDASDYIFSSPGDPQVISIPSKQIVVDGEIIMLRIRSGKPFRISGHNVKVVQWKDKVLFRRNGYQSELDITLDW